VKTPPALVVGIALVAAACAARTPRVTSSAPAPIAEIAVTSSPNTPVMIFASAPSRFALRTDAIRVRSDTIHTTTPALLKAYLDQGEINIVAESNVPIYVKATLAHAPALHVTATGHGAVLLQGGFGITTR